MKRYTLSLAESCGDAEDHRNSGTWRGLLEGGAEMTLIDEWIKQRAEYERLTKDGRMTTTATVAVTKYDNKSDALDHCEKLARMLTDDESHVPEAERWRYEVLECEHSASVAVYDETGRRLSPIEIVRW